MNNLFGRPVRILLVEDNLADIRLTKEVFKTSKVLNEIEIANDGVEAINYLKKTGKYESNKTPDLILLDLNLPKKDGREVLAEIKSDLNLRKIPIIILTISKDEEDILKSYSLYANCYITKPINLEQFNNVIKSIEDFWFTIVKLPSDYIN
ncbi:MAG: response regulator [Bacteroidetes bacterium]|nr:response regulator [Bacteroidota bacterium]